MNRKFVLMVFVLLVGAVFLSACQSEVGIRPAKKLATGGSDTSPSKIMPMVEKSFGERILILLIIVLRMH